VFQKTQVTLYLNQTTRNSAGQIVTSKNKEVIGRLANGTLGVIAIKSPNGTYTKVPDKTTPLPAATKTTTATTPAPTPKAGTVPTVSRPASNAELVAFMNGATPEQLSYIASENRRTNNVQIQSNGAGNFNVISTETKTNAPDNSSVNYGTVQPANYGFNPIDYSTRSAEQLTSKTELIQPQHILNE
jgi:hypothetical protein